MSQEVEPGWEVAPGFGADASSEPEPEEDVEAEAEAEEQVEDQESEAESPPADEEDVDEKTDPFQERIDKLTKNWRETERALEALERENLELREKVRAIPKPSEPAKTLADFGYDEGKFHDYLFAEARKEAREAAAEALYEQQTATKEQELLVKFVELEREFKASVKDYDEVVYARDLRISDAMAEAIRDSDIGPEVAYHLGKNPATARRISTLPAGSAGREIALIESELRAEKQKASARKKVSDAPPPPVTKIGGGEPSRKPSTTSPESDKMSDKEWFEAEQKRLAKKRG